MPEDLPGPDLVTTLERADDGTTLRVEGEVDLMTAPSLANAIAEAEAAGVDSDLTLDLREVTFMDSTGLRVLLEARERLSPGAPGGLRLLVTEGGSVERLLELVGVRELFAAD